jgi:hypothetical protein
MTIKTFGADSNHVEHLITKNTPAVTIVAACIKAETGVGPSIASGSQICKPICADLPIAPISKVEQIISITLYSFPKKYMVNLKFLSNNKQEITSKSTLRKIA